MKRRKRRWFIEPRDKRTNDALAGRISEENFAIRQTTLHREVMVWECSREMVEYFLRSRRHEGLEFNVFTSLEDEIYIRYAPLKMLKDGDWTLLFSASPTQQIVDQLLKQVRASAEKDKERNRL